MIFIDSGSNKHLDLTPILIFIHVWPLSFLFFFRKTNESNHDLSGIGSLLSPLDLALTFIFTFKYSYWWIKFELFAKFFNFHFFQFVSSFLMNTRMRPKAKRKKLRMNKRREKGSYFKIWFKGKILLGQALGPWWAFKRWVENYIKYSLVGTPDRSI